jgi:lipopolysaccharide export system permease protein
LILKQYINREILRTCAAIAVVLVLIFISTRFIAYIKMAVDGVVPSATVFKLVAIEIPTIAGFLLPLSFFIAVLMTLGRLYSESEMAVIKSVGLSDYQIAKNILSAALVVSAIAALLSLWLNPWANETSQRLRLEGKAEAKLGAFFPGRFKENKGSTKVSFIESTNDAGEINNIFSVSGLGPGSKQVTIQVAASGRVTKVENGSNSKRVFEQNTSASDTQSNIGNQGVNYIALNNGLTYVLDLESNRWNVTQYGEYFMQVEKQAVDSLLLATKSESTIALFKLADKNAYAEIHWRLSAPLSIIILCFMAVPLSRTAPRTGKFSRLFPAIMIYIIYAILLINGRQFIEDGKVPVILGFWWIHFIAVIFCFWRFNASKFRKIKGLKLKKKSESHD